MSTNITAAMVKELRERTGVGMSKCKDALVRAEGSVDTAIEILRKEGMASAVKKEGREAKEGFIGALETDDVVALLELNCETDFVAQNEAFKSFLSDLTKQIAATRPESVEALASQKYISDESITVEDHRNLLVQKYGENIQVKRVEIIKKDSNSSYGIYSHMGGKLITVIEIEGSSNVVALAKEVAMHVAAETPEYLISDKVPADLVEKEKEIARSQVQNKPANIIDKIIDGKLKAYFDDVCLLNQKYIKDSSLTVKQFVETSGVKQNLTLSVKQFWYWKIGQ